MGREGRERFGREGSLTGRETDLQKITTRSPEELPRYLMNHNEQHLIMSCLARHFKRLEQLGIQNSVEAEILVPTFFLQTMIMREEKKPHGNRQVCRHA